MRYWYDTEFDENGERIIPISFAATSEDGRDLYLINKGYLDAYENNKEYYWKGIHRAEPNKFVIDNVLDKISAEDVAQYGLPHGEWSDVLYKYLTDNGNVHDIELWGHFAAYDHIVYCQSFGRMIDLPSPLPMFTNDDMTIRNGQQPPPRGLDLPAHHALADAKYQKLQFEAWEEGNIKWQTLNRSY